jgi:sulfatase maturation enzyme AslB (radical SAM superfamily)
MALNISQSNRERDYNRISGKIKSWLYEIKRGHLTNHIIDRIKWHIEPKFHHVIDFPTHLDIETSVTCQMRCPMCRRKQMPIDLKHGMMNFSLFRRIIDESVSRGVYSVKLSWRGEPLLHPKIVQMVKYAKEKGISDVAFLTNGERLTPSLVEGLVDAGLDWISISVDGTGETYDRIRWPETSEGIIKKVTMLKKYRDDANRKKPLIRIQTIYAAIKDNPMEYFSVWEKIGDKIYVIADQARADNNPFPRDPLFICYEPWRRLVIG